MKITELELTALDLDGQQRFYEETLGLPLTGTATGKRTFGIGTTQLSFAQTASRPNGVYHFAFNIPENQFDDAKAWIAARTPILKDASGKDVFDFENWNARSLYFKDADGNILEFIARHELPNASQSPFGPGSFLCVSEIGLVTNDVLKTVAALEQTLGITPYGGPASETFSAVGDANGVFIVVKQNRIWMPDSGQPAVQMPFVAVVNDGVRVESDKFVEG